MLDISLMLYAFCLLIGIMLLFHTVMNTNSGEGLFLSCAVVIFSLYIFTYLHIPSGAIIALSAISVIGVIVWIIHSLKTHKWNFPAVISPSLTIIFLLYMGSLIIYHNASIQHIDEFHQWAAAIKYMLTHNTLPTGYDFIGGGGQYGFATSLFHLFFQEISGYSEPNMYVSSALLSGIGFMLPFSSYEWKDWKKAGIYSAIIYISLFSLYVYGTKSLYVDVPLAAWSGGLAGWWINRSKAQKKTNLLILCIGLILLHFIKQSAGLLMAVFVIIFVLLQTYVIEHRCLQQKINLRNLGILSGILCACTIFISSILIGLIMQLKPYTDPRQNTRPTEEIQAETTSSDDVLLQKILAKMQEEQPQKWTLAGYKLPKHICDIINNVQLSKEKATLTFDSYITNIFGKTLASRSELSITYFIFILFMIIMMKLCGELYAQKERCTGYIFYMIFTAISYTVILYFSFLFMFAYELSITARSASRYFSICCIYFFILVLTVLLQKQNAKYEKISEYITYALLFLFLTGLNQKYIPNSTGFNQTTSSGYTKISNSMKQVQEIKKTIKDSDKVYLICQQNSEKLSDAELSLCPALYYMDSQVSNYLWTPWNFHKNGCNIRLSNFDIFTISDLPELLINGHYSYVWIHTSNKYLKNELPQVMNCDKISGNSLYKIIYENNRAVGLKFIRSLK